MATVRSSKQNLPTGGHAAHEAAQESIPLPRSPRRRQKSKLDRGLADDFELARLAEAFLEWQRQKYPAAAASGAIPVANPEIIDAMVADFKQRHRGGAVDPERIKSLLKAVGVSKAGGAYNRYSSNNSETTSILDQLRNSLEKSFHEGRFIPWEYVFADFAVTGLDASRRGYMSYKHVLSDRQHLIETTYIDDFTRASRDTLEWWKLAALSQRLKKRMIGASDGFDLANPNWDLMITIYCLVSRLFIKSLQEKVGRGMKGAADRGTNLGRLSFGFTRRQKLDAAGKLMTRSDGRPLYERCIDPETSEHRRLMYELYVRENWSATKIAKHFNQHQIENWTGWSTRTICDILWHESAIGVFIWNKTHREFDHEEEKWVTKRNPRSEWKVFYSRELAIVPHELWRAARRKLARERRPSVQTGRPKSRNEKNPSTLFSGTLFCDCCEKELKLLRSAGAAKQLGSVGGNVGAHGCRLSGSRSTRVIEECLLGYLRDRLLTPEVVSKLVTKANAFLDEEAKKPIPQTDKLKKQIADRQRQIDRLVRRSAATDDDGVAAKYEAEIKRLTQEVKKYQAVVSAAQAAERRKIERLDLDTAVELLAGLRTVLDEDIAVAGPAIRELTGSIRVRQKPIEGTKGRARWIASFTPQVSALVQKVCPSESGQFAAASLSKADAVEVILEKMPKYKQLAMEFQRLRDDGVGPMEIAAKCEVGHHTLMDGLHFADTGQRRNSRPKSLRNRTRYKEIASEVVQLIDEDDMQIKDVARRLEVSESVVRRAYDYLRPDTPRVHMGSGKLCRRRKSKRLPKQVFETIRRLASTGTSPKQIAEEAGCSERTVQREIERIENQKRTDTKAHNKSA